MKGEHTFINLCKALTALPMIIMIWTFRWAGFNQTTSQSSHVITTSGITRRLISYSRWGLYNVPGGITFDDSFINMFAIISCHASLHTGRYYNPSEWLRQNYFSPLTQRLERKTFISPDICERHLPIFFWEFAARQLQTGRLYQFIGF